MYQEINFDGLVGPTHNYAGLAAGNLASAAHRNQVAHPRTAALQGLRKMKALADLGVPQAVLPPLERPSIHWLRSFGFTGASEADVLADAQSKAPHLLAACASASSMWTANAATVAPSCDSADRRLHLTPANLSSHLHRALEAEETTRVLRTIFADSEHFVIHDPLPGGHAMRDEGAANHTRLCPDFGDQGLHMFVFGIDEAQPGDGPKRFAARQTKASAEAVARRHRLSDGRVFLAAQSPLAIDSGVFHNDVIAVGHRHLLLHHEEAFRDANKLLQNLDTQYAQCFGRGLSRIVVPAARIDLETAVKTYLFNSQIVSVPGDGEHLVAASECAETPAVSGFIDELIDDSSNSIQRVHYFDLRESMRNGGGPACLRQRVVMNPAERSAVGARVFLDDALYAGLVAWVERHYREELHPTELADPALLRETREALDQLTTLMELGAVFRFQG